MTFYVQGLTVSELKPLRIKDVFKEAIVEKTKATDATHALNETEHRTEPVKYSQQHDAAHAYQSVEQIPRAPSVVLAEQIMVSPVVTLDSQATIEKALTLFRTSKFRHLPVVSSAGELEGIVSERDILRHLAGVTENYQQMLKHHRGESIVQMMKSPVLTASGDTDVRYIARLFVEQRIGALPIVTDGEIIGIITRSDVLKAVMRHFVLELWV
jgi:acetoin utilization protein AcuB